MHSSTRQKPFANSFVTIALAVSLAISSIGVMHFVTYRNKQTIIRNNTQKTEDLILAINQDDIPSLKSKIEQQLDSYRVKERLNENRSLLAPCPPACREIINGKEPTILTR